MDLFTRNLRELVENKMFDGKNCIFVKNWLAQKIISTYGDKLYITPIINSFKMNIKKAIKIDKEQIKDITIKVSNWSGDKIEIFLIDGTKYSYSIPHRSWLDNAEMIKIRFCKKWNFNSYFYDANKKDLIKW